MRKVTILYFADEEVLKSLSFSVPDGSFITGDPHSWGDGSWKIGKTGDYGYQKKINDNETKSYFFRKDGEYYSFSYSQSDRLFSTQSPVTSDLNLQPVYKETASNADINLVYYISNVSYDQRGVPSYSLKECRYSENFPAGDDGKYVFTVQNFINKVRDSSKVGIDNVQLLDVEVGYGYVDYADNGKRYYLDPSDYTLIDKDGNIYENQVSVAGDTDLYFRYTEAGYAPMEDYLGVANTRPVYLDMVYIPGTEGTKYPWPNSQADVPGDFAKKQIATEIGGFSDTKDYSHPIRDLMVMEVPVTISFIKSIINEPFEDVFNTEFKFYSTEDGSTVPVQFRENGALSFADGYPWSYAKIDVAMLMANMLTYLYNQSNKNAAGFEPLGYVYKLSNTNLPLKDITAADYDISNVVIDHNANGFRLMSSSEWEYCSKVITDERQVPAFGTDLNADSRFHKKGDLTGYKFYFQNSNDGKYGILNEQSNGRLYYSGSGAGLATAVEATGSRAYKINSVNASHYGVSDFNYVIRYQPGTPRQGYMALGRDSSTNKLDTTYEVKKIPDSFSYSVYNTRNGAGLYHMNGFVFQLTDSEFKDLVPYNDNTLNRKFVMRSSPWKCTAPSTTSATSPHYHMIGTVLSSPGDIYEAWSDVSVRFCRNAVSK